MHRLRASVLFFGFVCAISAVCAQSLPQPLPQTQSSGAPRTIVLPKILVAGERATLAVLDARGRLVPAVDVELLPGGRLTTDATGRATFIAPPGAGILTARITETALDFSAAVLAVPKGATLDPISAKEAGSSPRLSYPPLIVLQDRFDVEGSGFSGDAEFNRVILGNLPALVLAASPVSLVALPNPHAVVGPAELLVGNAGKLKSLPVTIISLQVVGPASSLSASAKSALTVSVNGSTERLFVDVQNLSPGIVTMPRGNNQRLATSGGASNIAKVEFTAVRPGDYSVSARLAALPDSPAVEAARRQLLAARQLADAAWQPRLQTLVLKIEAEQLRLRETDANRVASFRQNIEFLLRDHPQENVAALLRAANQSLLNR